MNNLSPNLPVSHFNSVSPFPRPSTFKTFNGTAHSNLNERSQFEMVLHNFLMKRNISIGMIPVVNNSQIDTFCLFHFVIQDGGLESVKP
jgi:hypothetical protein